MIPGHGGIMDRFDCQFLMATFVNVYISSFIRTASPAKLLTQVSVLYFVYYVDLCRHNYSSLSAFFLFFLLRRTHIFCEEHLRRMYRKFLVFIEICSDFELNRANENTEAV